MNAITLLAYNNLELTKRALESALSQDIPCDIYVIDNGSKDGTWEWIRPYDGAQGHHRVHCLHFEHNRPPVLVGNIMLCNLFQNDNFDHVLGMPNDVVIPSNLYRLMLESPRGIVTASMTQDPNFPRFDKATAVNECTPLCVALIRKWAYDAIVGLSGYFWDEGYVHYASDCDLAVRMGACGIRGVQIDVQYYHEISATLKRSGPEARREMEQQADRDRAYFRGKWGFDVGSWEYGNFVSDINQKGIPLTEAVKAG